MILVPLQAWWLLLLVPLLFSTYAEGRLRSFFPGIYPEAIDHPDQQWVWQKLDHFNRTVLGLWRQRYFINDVFYKKNGPVFLELEGEQSAVDTWVHGSSLLRYAEKMGALYVLLEHRYYGKSQPTKDLSTDNLQFLSTKQALKDAVYFRKYLINKLKLFGNKWVVFGASYAGSLAAWLRVKHPTMFHSAVAYSAPVYAKANFSEYLEVVQNVLLRYGHDKCVDAVRNASQVLMYMLKHEDYHSNISRDFRLCNGSSIDSEMRMSYFLNSLISKVALLVQDNIERPLNKGQMNYDFTQRVKKSDLTLNYFCGMMTAESLGTPYERYAYFSKKNLEAQKGSCLYVNYDKFLVKVRNPDWDGKAAEGDRQWLYQTCTELGFFHTTDSENQPFLGLPMRFFITLCKQAFDLKIDINSIIQAVEDTNKYYYLPLIRTGSRILFPNGDIDPWHSLSINSRMERNLVGMSIENSSHCEAILHDQINDPENLKAARRFIFRTLISWLRNDRK